MSYYLDVTYLNLLASQLRNFKRKSRELVNCSCPLCGDSKKNKTKARGYFIKVEDSIIFKCHNCGKSKHFSKILQTVNPALYDEYIFHKYRNKMGVTAEPTTSPEIIKEEIKLTPLDLPNLKELDDSHYAKKYILGRNIPENKLDSIYFTDNWSKFSSETINIKYSNDPSDHRIVLPFYDINKNLVGAQGRSLSGDKKQRYLTAKKDGVEHITFGLQNWNKFQQTYVVEGPIDSLFLPNALAVASSDLLSIVNRVPNINIEKTTFIFDNEPYSLEITKFMARAINKGYRVFVWPTQIKQKDINDCVSFGYTTAEFLDIVSKRTYVRLEAEMELSSWKKV